jgi:hypothetical protein
MRQTTAATVNEDYAHLPRDEHGRILMWRGVGEDGAHMTFVNQPDPEHPEGNPFHFRPPASWDEVEQNHAGENWPNYGSYWGTESQAKFYGGDANARHPHGAMAVQAWFPGEHVHDSDNWEDGVWVHPGAQGEVVQAHVYHQGRGWQPLPDAPGRTVTAATDPNGLTGVNINDDPQDYTGQILRGEKTIETRDAPTLHHTVGQRIALVSTRRRPRRPALVVGYATVGKPVFYPDADAFDADYDRHLVDGDSPHHISAPTNKTGTKYGYPMLDVEATEPFPAPPGGIVTRKNMQFGDRR